MKVLPQLQAHASSPICAPAFAPRDEDITPSDTNGIPHMDMQGSITRARAHQLNQQVSSFLCSFGNYENGMLPNDAIIFGENGEDQEVFG